MSFASYNDKSNFIDLNPFDYLCYLITDYILCQKINGFTKKKFLKEMYLEQT